ncbi:uncharacterized protein LOC114294746 [Camellia sinensis]|uniref:uncharacterized protein LOC114294746 n=1 Tax=Camellia sinensis TaxID=4442 RepID=UPI001035A7CB|nr:uncharacterized protein LOC114294746 [Camellia sinensis]
MNHDYPDTSNLRHVQQQNRERRRLYLQQRRQRSTSEPNAQTEQPQREFEQLRLQSLSTEQRSARLEQRRLAQRRRRLFIREESATSNVQQREIQRESWRNYARQRRAALTIEQHEQQLARRQTNYRQRRQISENLEQTTHPNQVHNMTNAQTRRKMNHDYPDTSNLRHVQQQNRERRRLYLQQRRQRSASEPNAQTEQPQREFEQLRLQSLSTEQRSARLEQRRLAQRRRRLFIREESATSNVQQREIQRESWRNYARQKRAALTIEQREQQLARRQTNYRQRRQISENLEQTSHPNQDALSDEDIPDNRSFIHRRYHNCARNFHESERFPRMRFPAPTTCRHCNARLFHRETSTMCCNNGTIILPPVTAPNEIIDIFSDQTVEGRHFRQNIRAYNHVFSFTSMDVHVDENLATRTQGVYTFRAQGAIYHKIGSLLPNSSDRPRYLQLYVYDTDYENENRMFKNEELHLDLLDKIKNILNTHNPFVHTFRQLAQRPYIHECRLQIKEKPRNRPQYNLLTAPEVAAVLVGGKEAGNLKPRDIIVQSTSGHLLNISNIVGYYDPLHYPLLSPYGLYGWDANTRSNDGRKVTCCDLYSYMLQIRPGDQSLFLRGGRLLQQYVVDNYVKIESNKLRWIRTHQNHIRADFYQGLLDAIHAGENYGGNVGRRTILPSSFVGSPRDMYQRYQDAMALVQKYGKPDLFLTMTCNPNWPEIKAELLPGQSPHDRPDLLTRIFNFIFLLFLLIYNFSNEK